MYGDEGFIFADARCRGAEKRSELQEVAEGWYIAERLGKVRELKKHLRINKVNIRTEYLKACEPANKSLIQAETSGVTELWCGLKLLIRIIPNGNAHNKSVYSMIADAKCIVC